MIFDKIIGHKRQTDTLKHSDLGQAYLFSGPSGIGKKLIALACAQKILCTEKNKPCGKCSSCVRVEKQSHPDLLVVSSDEVFIKIDLIRQIQNFVNLRAFEKSNAKVVIIDNAQKMNPQAANALLKTLEEPPEGSHFFLVTSQKGAMLPTILSRCQKFSFGALGEAEIKTIHPDAPSWALPLSQGRLDLLNQWIDESKKSLRGDLLAVLRQLPEASAYESFTSLENLSDDRDSALFSTLLWHHWIRQTLATKLGLQAMGTQDETEVFTMLAKKTSVEGLLDLSGRLLRLENDITANVNRRLAFEQFWLHASGIFRGETNP